MSSLSSPTTPSATRFSSARWRSTMRLRISAARRLSTSSCWVAGSGACSAGKASSSPDPATTRAATASRCSRWCSWKPPATSLSAPSASASRSGRSCSVNYSWGHFSIRSSDAGQGDTLFEGEDGGVEALQVAHLEDGAPTAGGVDQPVGRGKVTGDGLFHQEVDAGVEEVAADFGVDGGRRGDDGGVDFAGEAARVGEGKGLVAGGGFGGAGGGGVDDGGEGVAAG